MIPDRPAIPLRFPDERDPGRHRPCPRRREVVDLEPDDGPRTEKIVVPVVESVDVQLSPIPSRNRTAPVASCTVSSPITSR